MQMTDIHPWPPLAGLTRLSSGCAPGLRWVHCNSVTDLSISNCRLRPAYGSYHNCQQWSERDGETSGKWKWRSLISSESPHKVIPSANLRRKRNCEEGSIRTEVTRQSSSGHLSVTLSAVLTLTSDIWSKTNFLRLLPANNYCQVWDYEKLTVRHFPSVNKTPWPIKWVSEPETGSAVRSWLSWWLNVVIRDCCDQPRKWLPPNEHLNGKLVE